MKSKTRKIIISIFLVISILVACYVVPIGYLVTNGYRDYVGFCSEYIDQIDEYKSNSGKYPDELSFLDKPIFWFRYRNNSCSYYSSYDGYGFSTPCSLIGTAYYNSRDKK